MEAGLVERFESALLAEHFWFLQRAQQDHLMITPHDLLILTVHYGLTNSPNSTNTTRLWIRFHPLVIRQHGLWSNHVSPKAYIITSTPPLNFIQVYFNVPRHCERFRWDGVERTHWVSMNNLAYKSRLEGMAQIELSTPATNLAQTIRTALGTC